MTTSSTTPAAPQLTPVLVVQMYRRALALPDSSALKRPLMDYAHGLRRQLHGRLTDDSADLLVVDGAQ